MSIKNILHLDIGGTNTTAAVLNSTMTIGELSKITPEKRRTIGYMNESLPDIIHEFNQFDDYEEIFINCPFEIIDKKTIAPNDYYVKERGVPSDFPVKVSKIIDKPVFIENDAVAWMRGNLKYQELIGNNVNFPALTLCFGTGIGMAISNSMTDIEEYNISRKFRGYHFPELTNTAGYFLKNPTAGKVHDILGKGFFNWAEKERKGWTKEKISKEFTERFLALLSDFEQHKSFNYEDIRSIFLCGGNSTYLNKELIEKNSDLEFYYHDKESININPDLIPLIGNIECS